VLAVAVAVVQERVQERVQQPRQQSRMLWHGLRWAVVVLLAVLAVLAVLMLATAVSHRSQHPELHQHSTQPLDPRLN
jgi:hypothetical protein